MVETTHNGTKRVNAVYRFVIDDQLRDVVGQNVMQLVVGQLLLPLLLQHFDEMKRMNVIDRYVIDDLQRDYVGRVRLT
uniref:PHB domain-containing protein n=1 Tax=Angiostrongylus cantonensis TaxID=6313 RepID=A0A0K0DFH9_ANGCA